MGSPAPAQGWPDRKSRGQERGRALYIKDMLIQESFYRGPALRAEPRRLPAQIYNLARLLVARSGSGSAFVPIRPMQYLAVLDDEEFIFVHREARPWIEVAWQSFGSRKRNRLDAPVPYQCVYYMERGVQIMGRLQSEFHKALREAAEKQPLEETGRVVPLQSP